MAVGRARKGFLALTASVVAIVAGGCGGDDAGGGSTAHLVHLQRAQRRAAARSPTAARRSRAVATTIEFELLPNEADSQREQLVRRLGAEDYSIDLIGMDVIWTGEFANAGWLEPVPPARPSRW